MATNVTNATIYSNLIPSLAPTNRCEHKEQLQNIQLDTKSVISGVAKQKLKNFNCTYLKNFD